MRHLVHWSTRGIDLIGCVMGGHKILSVIAPEAAAERVRLLGSVPWSGRNLAKLIEVHSRTELRKALHRGDWWLHGVLPLGILNLALFATLQARPGWIGSVLWKWGPTTLAGVSVLLLFAAFWSGLWNRRTGNRWRIAGYVGLVVLVFTISLYRTYPSSHDGTPSRARFELPLRGPVTVAWGGPSPDVNYHVAAPTQRWAYDLLVTHGSRSYRAEGKSLTDYYAYSRPVYAPAGGRVISVKDGEPDIAPDRRMRGQGAGNHLVIEVAAGEYLFIAHLQAGSIAVVPGQQLTAGQVIGRVGNSGRTSEPHVHLHLQDTPIADAGEGIPFLFSDYVTLGTGRFVERGMPRGGIRAGEFSGEMIESIPASAER